MRCALAACLACLLLGPLSAQAAPSPSTASRPEASAPLSTQLDDLATKLEQALTDSATDWEILSSTLTDLSSMLASSATSSRALELESESMQVSLSSLGLSLAEATKQARRHSFVAGLWRVGALSLGAGLAGSLLDARRLRGAGYGAGLGAVAGGVWMLAERWPLLKVGAN